MPGGVRGARWPGLVGAPSRSATESLGEQRPEATRPCQTWQPLTLGALWGSRSRGAASPVFLGVSALVAPRLSPQGSRAGRSLALAGPQSGYCSGRQRPTGMAQSAASGRPAWTRPATLGRAPGCPLSSQFPGDFSEHQPSAASPAGRLPTSGTCPPLKHVGGCRPVLGRSPEAPPTLPPPRETPRRSGWVAGELLL